MITTVGILVAETGILSKFGLGNGIATPPPPPPPPPFVTLLSNLRRVNQLAVTMCKEVVNGLFPVASATFFKRLRKFIPILNNSDNNLFIPRPLSGAGI